MDGWMDGRKNGGREERWEQENGQRTMEEGKEDRGQMVWRGMKRGCGMEKKEGKRHKKGQERRGRKNKGGGRIDGGKDDSWSRNKQNGWSEGDGEKQGRWMGEERDGRVEETGGKSDRSTKTNTKASSDLSATPAT